MEASRQERPEVFGDALWQRHLVILNNSVQCRHWLKVKVGGRASEKLYDNAANAPDVRRCSAASHLNNLRGHPIWSANWVKVIIWRSVALSGDPEIGKLYLALHVNR